jgi:iron(III) transport system substrate-binding protein
MLKRLRVTLVLIVFLFLGDQLVLSQDAKTIQAAKKEGGKAVVYGTGESEITDAVIKAFRKKTGLDVDYWRASATKVLDRVVSEYRASKPIFDVVMISDSPLRIMFKEGILAKYESPVFKNFPKEAIDPDLGPRYRNFVIGIMFNKSVIKPADAPKSLEDLLKPQYKGRLVMPDPTQHTTTTQWLASLWKIVGKEKADKYIQDLAATKPVLVESLLPAAMHVTTGETPIAITYIKYAYIYGKEGAPVDYVRLGKMMGDGHWISLSNKAPHASAGKAFIDYFLGDESMKIMAERGEFVNRKGVYPPLPDADKIQFVEMVDLSAKEFAEKKKEYHKLFLQ